MAGVAQSNARRRFVMESLAQSHICLVCVLGVPLTGHVWACLAAEEAAAYCVAILAQFHMHLRFPWWAWHNLTSAFVFMWQV